MLERILGNSTIFKSMCEHPGSYVAGLLIIILGVMFVHFGGHNDKTPRY